MNATPRRALEALRDGAPVAREILEDGLMFAADAREFLSSVHDGTADLVFLDPPFNLGKRYGKSPAREDRLTDAEYCDFLEDVIRNSVRVLREGGSLFVYHLPVWALRIGAILEGELEFCHWIAVSMKGSFPLDGRLYPAHYALLYYSKGTPRVFHRPKIPPAKCRHCDKIVKDYGGYVKHIREGLNLSDVWDDLSPVRRRRNKRRAGNELPLELLRRVMAIGGERGRLLVDPFAGAGTSLVAAREIGMEFIACDREEERCDVIRKRLATVGEGDGELSGEEVSAVDETDPEVLRGYGFRDGEEGSDGESVGL